MIEIKHLRDHYSKHFQNNDGTFTCRQSLSLAHYFNGETFEEIEEIPFPEGKEINSEKDLKMIEIPSWASVELSEDKAYFVDKKGVRIHVFKEAAVCYKKEPHSFEKGKVVIDKSKLIKAKFKVIDNHLGFELPDKVKAKDLKAFDDTDTGSTNNGDCRVNENFPTSNENGAGLYIGDLYTSKRTRTYIKFTLTSGSGLISAIKLYLRSIEGTKSLSAEIHSSSNSWIETGITWNNQPGYNATVISTINTTSYSWNAFPLFGAGTTNPLSINWGDTVDLVIVRNPEISDSRNFMGFDEKEGTNKPYIEITYTTTTYSNTIQAKARIKKLANAKTVQAKLDIKKEATKTISSKCSIKKTLEKVVSSKTRIQISDIVNTISPKARIQRIESKNITSKLSIFKNTVKTISSKCSVKTFPEQTVFSRALITNLSQQTLSSKARIFISGVTKSSQSKLNIKKSTLNTGLTSKARIQISNITKVVSSKSKIQKLEVKTVSSKTSIFHFFTKTVSSKSIIEKLFKKSISSKASIFVHQEKTISSKARILIGGVTKSLFSRLDIKKTTSFGLTSRARIEILSEKTILAKVRVQILSYREIISKLSIRNYLTKEISSRLALKRVISNSILSKTRVLVGGVTK